MTSSEQDLAALSALMDDEASELELRRVLGSLNSDPALRTRWRRQQLVRDLMRGRLAVRPEIDVSADCHEGYKSSAGFGPKSPVEYGGCSLCDNCCRVGRADPEASR